VTFIAKSTEFPGKTTTSSRTSTACDMEDPWARRGGATGHRQGRQLDDREPFASDKVEENHNIVGRVLLGLDDALRRTLSPTRAFPRSGGEDAARRA
jgi:hypothetical protein